MQARHTQNYIYDEIVMMIKSYECVQPEILHTYTTSPLSKHESNPFVFYQVFNTLCNINVHPNKEKASLLYVM